MIKATRAARNRGERTLRAVRPNQGLELAYRRKLEKMIQAVHKSCLYWIKAQYRKTPPAMAQDASPMDYLTRLIRKLRNKWLKQIDQTAPKLAAYFDQKVSDRTDAALKKILRDGGFSVKMQWTEAMRDISAASIQGNVSLIKSIPAKYFDNIEQIISQGFANGYDLKRVTDDLQQQFGVTRRRASFIARDQSSKLSSQYTRARHMELGITHAKLRHSHAGKEPRRTHRAMDGKEYEIAKGFWDPEAKRLKGGKFQGEWVQPGELINCFPGDVCVKFAKDVKKVFRYWFDGELTELVLETGETLRATLNHPVLTPDGWIAIGLLKKGDYIVQIAQESVFAIPDEIDGNDAIASIGDVFDTLAAKAHRRVSRGANFHGDIVEGDVDIVFTAGPLSFGIETEFTEGRLKLTLPHANDAGLSFGPRKQLVFGALDASDSGVCGVGQSLSPIGANTVHPDLVGATDVATSDAVFHENAAHDNALASAAEAKGYGKFALSCKVSGNDSGLVDVGVPVVRWPPQMSVRDCDAAGAQVLTEAVGINTDNGGDFDKGLSLGYETLRVVNNVRRRFRDHVYTLETASGWFAVTSAGIVTKNCRCTASPIIPGFS